MADNDEKSNGKLYCLETAIVSCLEMPREKCSAKLTELCNAVVNGVNEAMQELNMNRRLWRSNDLLGVGDATIMALYRHGADTEGLTEGADPEEVLERYCREWKTVMSVLVHCANGDAHGVLYYYFYWALKIHHRIVTFFAENREILETMSRLYEKVGR